MTTCTLMDSEKEDSIKKRNLEKARIAKLSLQNALPAPHFLSSPEYKKRRSHGNIKVILSIYVPFLRFGRCGHRSSCRNIVVFREDGRTATILSGKRLSNFEDEIKAASKMRKSLSKQDFRRAAWKAGPYRFRSLGIPD